MSKINDFIDDIKFFIGYIMESEFNLIKCTNDLFANIVLLFAQYKCSYQRKFDFLILFIKFCR